MPDVDLFAGWHDLPCRCVDREQPLPLHHKGFWEGLVHDWEHWDWAAKWVARGPRTPYNETMNAGLMECVP